MRSRTVAPSNTTFVRRDQVVPGMTVKSSHYGWVLVLEVIDTAETRTDDRHVEFRFDSPACIWNERYPAGSKIEVDADSIPLPELSLSDVAAEREKVRKRLERSRELVALLKPDWDEANANVHEDIRELARVDLAMVTAKRSHLITSAMMELGIETTEPPLIVVPSSSASILPTVFVLAALSADGKVGLYMREAEQRRGNKKHTIRSMHVPRAVLDKRAELDAERDSRSDLHHTLPFRSPEYEAARKASDQLVKQLAGELRELVGGHYEGLRPLGADLTGWEGRGRGSFGQGSGALRPLPSPTGAKWRWLKVKEQAELAGGA